MAIKVGDCVRVKSGVRDPDTDKKIDNWQGRVVDTQDDGLLLIEWDVVTLRTMNKNDIMSMMMDGYTWNQMWLSKKEVTTVDARSSVEEDEAVREQIETRIRAELPAVILMGKEGPVSRLLNKLPDEKLADKLWLINVTCIRGLHLDGKWIRKMKVRPRMSLTALHEAILNEIQFDSDHLYEFYIGNDRNYSRVLWAANADESECDAEDCHATFGRILLGCILPTPSPKTSLYYEFDFGDQWLFKIILEAGVELQPEKGKTYPEIVSGIGKNPLQYGKDEKW